MDFSHLFRVGYDDFFTLWDIDDPMCWQARFKVRQDGIFIPTLSETLVKKVSPDKLAFVSHPTGNPDEPLLAFPCSLEDMMGWGVDYSEIDFSSSVLILWMRGRVDFNRKLAAGSALNTIASKLFQVNRSQTKEIFQYIDPKAIHPEYPCPIDTLLSWRQDAVNAWVACESLDRPYVGPPSNAAIVRLIKERLSRRLAVAEAQSLPQGNYKTSSLVNIILALGGSAQIAWDRQTRDKLQHTIALLCKREGISLDGGEDGAKEIARKIQRAAVAGKITSNTPMEETIGKVLKVIRMSQNYLGSN
jgi:hypothetical protein